MIDALHIATSGLQSVQNQIDTLSNNLSNMQTPGFKAKRVSFGDIAVITPSQVQAGLTPAQSGAGSEVIATNAVFSQGQMQQTGNTWDIAIQGEGFLEVADTRAKGCGAPARLLRRSRDTRGARSGRRDAGRTRARRAVDHSGYPGAAGTGLH